MSCTFFTEVLGKILIFVRVTFTVLSPGRFELYVNFFQIQIAWISTKMLTYLTSLSWTCPKSDGLRPYLLIGQDLVGGWGDYREEFVYQWFLDTSRYLIHEITRYTGHITEQYLILSLSLGGMPKHETTVKIPKIPLPKHLHLSLWRLIIGKLSFLC